MMLLDKGWPILICTVTQRRDRYLSMDAKIEQIHLNVESCLSYFTKNSRTSTIIIAILVHLESGKGLPVWQYGKSLTSIIATHCKVHFLAHSKKKGILLQRSITMLELIWQKLSVFIFVEKDPQTIALNNNRVLIPKS